MDVAPKRCGKSSSLLTHLCMLVSHDFSKNGKHEQGVDLDQFNYKWQARLRSSDESHKSIANDCQKKVGEPPLKPPKIWSATSQKFQCRCPTSLILALWSYRYWKTGGWCQPLQFQPPSLHSPLRCINHWKYGWANGPTVNKMGPLGKKMGRRPEWLHLSWDMRPL